MTAASPASPGQSVTAPRQTWMDLLRGVAILLVIFLHTMSPLDDDGRTTPEQLLQVNDALAPFRIPTLVFLSGMLLAGSLRKGFARFARGKLEKIGWPYLVWSAVFLAVVGSTSPSTLLAVFYDPPTYLWYLFFLLIFYFLAYGLRTYAPQVPLAVVAAASAASGVLLPEDGRSQRFVFLFAFFLLGDLASTHLDQVRRVVALPGVWLAGAALSVVGAALSFDGTLVRYQPEHAWVVLGFLAVALRWTPRLAEAAWTEPLQFLGRQSLVYYVVHLPAILVAAKVVRAAGVDGPEVLVPVGMLAGLATGYLFVTAQRWAPAVGWLFSFPSHRLRRP